MRAGELCAGYGGLALAVEEVFGATTAWFCEFEDAPSKILKHHWPDVPNYGDMTQVNWSKAERVHVMSGGTPCQDLSHAGKRKGMTEGTRSNLWVHMREAIAIQRPRYVVWENVRGAYSAGADSDLEFCPGCLGDAGDGKHVLRALGRVLGDLSDLGYDCQWRGLRDADVGACHGRYRVFVLAQNRDGGRSRRGPVVAGHGQTSGTDTTADGSDHRSGGAGTTRATGEASDDPGSLRGHEALQHNGRGPQADDRASVPDESDREPVRLGPIGATAANSDSGDDDGRLPESKRCALDGTPTPRCGQVSRADIFSGRWCACDPPAVAGSESIGEQARGTSSEEARSESGDGSGHHHGEQPPTNWGPYAPAIRRWERVVGRDAPRPTEPTGRNGGERLSPRFTEWMMGLPDGWVTDPAIGISRNEQLKACGNGVVPQQAIAALRDMLAAFEQQERLVSSG